MTPRPDAKLLLDMLLSAKRSVQYVRGVERSRFDEDLVLQDAVVRRLEVLGEAAARISEATRATLPEIPWKAMVGMRNRIVHEYFRVDLDVVWDVVHEQIPLLIVRLEAVVPPDDDMTAP